MRVLALLLAALAWLAAPGAGAREVVEASAPTDLSVTIYRDPDRSEYDELRRDDPQGFALISETRTVTLPAGESTIRFIGVAEGMIGVSAIVTGLPGGTIEKNRNAELLSPAALVNGALGNRVTITRTNPATGAAVSEQAVVRTRADGGLVLQTGAGFEAVRCAGLPEKLTFARIPQGLSAQPVYSVDTRADSGGTYEVTLTYLSWGFDWQANYVATLAEPATGEAFRMNWLSWLTLVNDNAQSFDDAKLQIIAGRLNIETDFAELADPPQADPLRLTCYPIGSTSAGSPVPRYDKDGIPLPAPMAMAAYGAENIVVTGSMRRRSAFEAVADVVTAAEENLGDLKLFRVPDRIDVSASAMKQVAFLNRDAIEGRFLYSFDCDPDDLDDPGENMQPTSIVLETKNEEDKGLGIALPQGQMRVFEPTQAGLGLAAITSLRDYARGQEIELDLTESAQVQAHCTGLWTGREDREEGTAARWRKMFAVVTNANPHPVTLRLNLARSNEYQARFKGAKVVVKNGWQTAQVTIPANARRQFAWEARESHAD